MTEKTSTAAETSSVNNELSTPKPSTHASPIPSQTKTPERHTPEEKVTPSKLPPSRNAGATEYGAEADGEAENSVDEDAPLFRAFPIAPDHLLKKISQWGKGTKCVVKWSFRNYEDMINHSIGEVVSRKMRKKALHIQVFFFYFKNIKALIAE